MSELDIKAPKEEINKEDTIIHWWDSEWFQIWLELARHTYHEKKQN